MPARALTPLRRYPLPLPVVMLLVSASLMLVPAVHASVTGLPAVARAFFYSATALLILGLFLGIATWGFRPRSPARSHLRSLAGACLALPPLLALPMVQAVPDLTFGQAWFEMISGFTTTGATIIPAHELPGPVHLWRGLVGWAGGFFVLVSASAILAPLNIGGFELYGPRAFGRPAGLSRNYEGTEAEPADRLFEHALALLPAWLGITACLWAALLIAGDTELTALMHAMGTISTSGITPLDRFSAAPSGFAGEAVIFAGLTLALSRRFLPGAPQARVDFPLRRDPELRTALVILIAVPAALAFRHGLSELTEHDTLNVMRSLSALWGAVFTTLSFMTTTGFDSAAWPLTRIWSGMEEPGLFLLGLAMIGGGVATTTGGVKLLRIYALWSLGRRELERLSEPSSVAGGGAFARHIRTEGAFIAFVFFILFALTLGAMNLILAAMGLDFEAAILLSASALSGTGPMADISRISEIRWQDLESGPRVVLAAGMILGRLETLALIAFAMPQAWRR